MQKLQWTRSRKTRAILACELEKSKSKKEVILDAQRGKKKVHFATLINYKRYKGIVVLRDDIVKDNSGANAVFTEQGSSASQMTAQKNLMLLQDYWVVTD